MESNIFTHINTLPLPDADGPMAGIRIGVEPNISVADWPTDAQSPALENYVALEDATLVSRLREKGAHLKGRTTMGELGLGLDNDTGADAVNKNILDAVLKTDTTGETRVLAAAAGCFGYKPSYGMISRFGIMGLVPSMESCGILARSLETIMKSAHAMTGLDDRDPTMDESDTGQALSLFNQDRALPDTAVTVGVIQESVSALGQNESKCFEQTIEKLATAGVKIKSLSISDLALASTVHNIIGSVEASSSAGRFDSVRYGHRTSALVKNWNEMYIKSRGESFGPLVKTYLFQGGYFQYRNYQAFLDACRIRARLLESIDSVFNTVDLIIQPLSDNLKQAVQRPETITGLYSTFSQTLLANLTGNPCISIPGSVNGDITAPPVQLMGKRFEDARLLDLAGRISHIHTGEI